MCAQGIPLQRMDPFIFDACGSAPLCGVTDQVTPINNAKRSNYLNTGCLVLRPNRTYHTFLLREAAQDAARPRARYCTWRPCPRPWLEPVPQLPPLYVDDQNGFCSNWLTPTSLPSKCSDAEQGFFHERGIPWKKLPGGFNVQAGLLKRRWKLELQQPARANVSDFFLHKKVRVRANARR